VCCVLYIYIFNQTRRFYFILYIKNITVIDARNEIGVDVNTEKTMLLSCHQNEEQNHDIKVGNRSCENGAQFIYL
jgi:hypothetical protein